MNTFEQAKALVLSTFASESVASFLPDITYVMPGPFDPVTEIEFPGFELTFKALVEHYQFEQSGGTIQEDDVKILFPVDYLPFDINTQKPITVLTTDNIKLDGKEHSIVNKRNIFNLIWEIHAR